MQAGRLRHRVTIQSITSRRDDYGPPVEEWSNGATVWAEVLGISGRELVSSGAEMAEATIRVWIRYRTDITASSRLLCRSGPFRDLTLSIVGQPIPDARRTRLEILCKEGVKR